MTQVKFICSIEKKNVVAQLAGYQRADGFLFGWLVGFPSYLGAKLVKALFCPANPLCTPGFNYSPLDNWYAVDV